MSVFIQHFQHSRVVPKMKWNEKEYLIGSLSSLNFAIWTIKEKQLAINFGDLPFQFTAQNKQFKLKSFYLHMEDDFS